MIRKWVIHTRSEERPPAQLGANSRVDGSLLSDGCRIDGTAIRSIISPGVHIAEGAVVSDSIVMTDAVIESGAQVDRAILDKRVQIGRDAVLGDGVTTRKIRSGPRVSIWGLRS